MSISGEQSDIQVEPHAEPGVGLVTCRRAMGEKDDKVAAPSDRASNRERSPFRPSIQCRTSV